MSIRYRGGSWDMPANAVFPSFVPNRLTFSGVAWGAIAGDRTPTDGDVDIILEIGGLIPEINNARSRWLFFDFDFPGTRLDGNFANDISVLGWDWETGSLIGAPNNAPIGIYGVEGYDNSAGVAVEAAYLANVDDYLN